MVHDGGRMKVDYSDVLKHNIDLVCYIYEQRGMVELQKGAV